MSHFPTLLPPQLAEERDKIRQIAIDYDLDFFEVIYEMVNFQQMNEIAAYMGFPTRYPHWRWGMEYERMRKSYAYGLHRIYEMVINNDPCYAYLLDSNELVDQKIVMAHVYGHCLAPETRIETFDGIKAITEVQVGDKVLTHTGVYRPVRVRSERWFTGEIYGLMIAGTNQKVRITGEHPLLVMKPTSSVLDNGQKVKSGPNWKVEHKCSASLPYESYELQWLPAAEVQAGDIVAFPRRQPVLEQIPEAITIPINKELDRQPIYYGGQHEVTIDPALAKLIGYFIAEGNALEAGLLNFGFHLEETESELATPLFDVNVAEDIRHDSNATTIGFNSLEVGDWLREHVGTYSHNKRIPDFLLEHPDDEVRLACLQGIFYGDGNHTSHSNRDSSSLSITTTSETLAYQLRHLCLRWDIKTRIYVRQKKAQQIAYEVVWTGRSAHKLSELIFGEELIKGNRSFEPNWFDEHYLYQEVRSVEREKYDGPVYNFSVEEDESYTLAAGLVVHNCDFFKNNMWFAKTDRKMMDHTANHATRIWRIIDRIGMEEVEEFIDVCLSLENLIDRHAPYYEKAVSEDKQEDKEDIEVDMRRPQVAKLRVTRNYMDSFINPPDVLKTEAEERSQELREKVVRFPAEPQRDVLLFLLENAPLERWQQEILHIIRKEAYYFAPQGMTKVMNEGWACVVAGSLLYTEHGLLPIEEIVEQRTALQVSDGTELRQIYDWAKFENRETIWIRTKRGLELEGSLTHRLMLPDGSWRRLDELEVGDTLILGAPDNLWPKEYVQLDWQPQHRLTLQNIADQVGVDIESVMRYRSGVGGVHNEKLAQPVAEYEAQLAMSVMQNKPQPIGVPRVVDEDLAAFLGYMIADSHISEGLKTGAAARIKEVPEVILRSPKSVVASFLRAYFDCDAYAGQQGVILSTASEALGKTVQLLLLNFGILSSRRAQKDGCWHVHVTGKSAKIYQKEIGFAVHSKQEALKQYIEDAKWFKREVWEDNIVAIERRWADVYDISVEQTHRYAAQGFINHNSYWHSTIMTKTGVMTDAEVIDYADHHSGTVAMSPQRINPYKIGLELFRDIEERWDKGRFGKEWEECDDARLRHEWDKKTGLGRQKIFDIRRVYNDVGFIDTFFTEDFCNRNQLFTFNYNERTGRYEIDSRQFQEIKTKLLFSLTNFGQPIIQVQDANYENRGELLLEHRYEGVELKLDEARDTLKNMYKIWKRPIYIKTIIDDSPRLLSFNGKEHATRRIR